MKTEGGELEVRKIPTLTKIFPNVIRDATVTKDGELVLVTLSSGVLMGLNQKLELLKSTKLAQNFEEKPAPPLQIHVDDKGHVCVQISDKKLAVYHSSSLGVKALAEFNEPQSNTITDYQVLYDWRRASEDMEGEAFPDSIVLSTLTLDPIKSQTVVSIHRLWLD